MKFKFKSLLLLPILVAGLVACGNSKPTRTDEQCVDMVANLPTLLLKDGDPLIAGNHYDTEYGDRFLGLRFMKIDGKKVNVMWSDNSPETNKTSFTNDGTNPDRKKIEPMYAEGKENEFDITLKASISLNNVKATKEFYIHIASATIEPITLPQLAVKLSKEETINSKKHLYDFNGIVTGYMEKHKDHLYSGVYLQDGPYAVMLYAGCVDDLLSVEGFGIGSRIHARGFVSPYNGLNEIKPVSVKISDNSVEIAEPVAFELTSAEQWDQKALMIHQNQLVKAKGLEFVKSDKPSETNYWNMYFKLGDANITVGVNKHLGKEACRAIGEVANTLKAGDIVDIDAVLSWNTKDDEPEENPYPGARLSLQFIDTRTPADCIIVK